MSSSSHTSFIARKQRQCDSCLRMIEPGEVYLRTRLFSSSTRGLPKVLSKCEACTKMFGQGDLLREVPVKPPCTQCGKRDNRLRLGLCNLCYNTARRREQGVPPRRERIVVCQYDDCEREHFAKGRCRRHYQRDRLRAIRDGATMTMTVSGPSGPTRAVRRKAPEHEQHLEGRKGGMHLQDRPLASSPEPIGHWDVRPGITIVHWPTKETGAFPYTCPDCNEKILEAS